MTDRITPKFAMCPRCGERFRVPQRGEWWHQTGGGSVYIRDAPTEAHAGTAQLRASGGPAYAIHWDLLHRCAPWGRPAETASTFEGDAISGHTPPPLTESERMALCDILLEHIQRGDEVPQSFVDVARDVQTTTSGLLVRLTLPGDPR